MVQLAIRCQPRVPVAVDELEGWLELEVHELRDMQLLGLQPTLLAPRTVATTPLDGLVAERRL